MNPSQPASQISALARLQSLPELFRGTDLTIRFQWTSKTASQYLYLWKRRGLVQGLGGHSDVYANLLLNRHPNWEQAVLMAMPSAVVIGIEALRQAGWTPQIPQRPDIAVCEKGSTFSTLRYTVTPRPTRWFEATRPGLVLGTPRQNLPVLHPAWALADLLSQTDWGTFGLWPDDIDWLDLTPEDEAQWQKACQALALPAIGLLDLAQAPRTHGPIVCAAKNSPPPPTPSKAS